MGLLIFSNTEQILRRCHPERSEGSPAFLQPRGQRRSFASLRMTHSRLRVIVDRQAHPGEESRSGHGDRRNLGMLQDEWRRPMKALHTSMDEALELLSAYGPDLQNGMTSHAPMTAEALCAMGRPEAVMPWLERYRTG